jgi:hypothetical protein
LLVAGCALQLVQNTDNISMMQITLNIATKRSILSQQDHTVLTMFFMFVCVLNCFKPPPNSNNSFGGGDYFSTL